MDVAAFSRRPTFRMGVKVKSGDAEVGMTVGCRGAATSCGQVRHVIREPMAMELCWCPHRIIFVKSCRSTCARWRRAGSGQG